MKYFAGAGAGKGWHKFKFILKPEEFAEVFSLNKVNFVIANSRVDNDYEFSEKKNIFRAYENYYKKLCNGDVWDRKSDWKLDSEIRISIIDDLSKVKFNPVETKKESDKGKFKTIDVDEPVINLSPFSLLFASNKQLSIETFNETGNIGLEMNYPRVISLSSESHKMLHETSTFEVNKLFNQLIMDIKQLCKKAKIACADKEYKPNFWISENAKKDINGNWYLKQNKALLK